MASIEYVVNATDAASRVFAKIAMSADGLDKQLEDLDKRIAEPEVNLQDAKFTQGMIRAAERLDKLSAKVADPTVEVDTTKAQVEILRINAMLDRLGAKKVTAEVKVDVDRGMFGILGRSFLGAGGLLGRGIGGIGGLLGLGGRAIGGGASAISGGIGAVSAAGGQIAQALQFLAIAGAIGTGAVLSPALLPLGLAGLVGGGAATGAFALGSKADQQLTTLRNSLRTATGARRRLIQQQIAGIRQSRGPELAAFGGLENIGTAALGVFSGALTSTGRGFSGGGPGGTQNQSFLGSLAAILKQIAGFVKTIHLGEIFRASIPYLQMFVKFLEQATRALLPAFTKMLVEFQPYLPVLARGLMDIVKGMVGFLNAIGPSGMKAAARIFVILAEGMAASLVALGHTINWLAENTPKWVRFITNEWKTLSHETAVIFDGVRHEIAHVWDMIFGNTLGRLERGRHDIAVEWDKWRHDIAHVWDVIYNDTIGTVVRLDRAIVGWFSKLPSQLIRALWGLGHSLASFMRAAWNEMWSAARNVGGSILSWVKGWASNLWHGLLHFFHIGSPSGLFYDIGRNLMLGLRNGIADHVKHVAGAMTGVTGAIGGDALANQALARRIFPWNASQWPPFVSLVMAESGFNRFARNPSSGAYGIAQALPPTKYPFAGQAAGGSHAGPQLAWMFNYIAGRYGSPAAAWAHELAYHWYDRGGWLPPGVSLAVNQTGRPERVLGPGGGGNIYNINIAVPVAANKADVGRQVVEAIREYEKRSGPGWRR